jgi:hypothetical protein
VSKRDPNAATVFYSWQSESSEATNRNFIEDALRRAIRAINAQAGPQRLGFDKDTVGRSGSPPVLETLLGKIADAEVFVGDLTLVGRRKGARSPGMPNANVNLEWGYAMGRLGHDRLVGVVNGNERNWKRTPFNLYTMRHPIMYQLAETDSREVRRNVRAELVKDLTKAIGACQAAAHTSHNNRWKGGHWQHLDRLRAGERSKELHPRPPVDWARSILDWGPKNDLIVCVTGSGAVLVSRADGLSETREIAFVCRVVTLPHPIRR